MADTAAHLVDCVFPEVPVRQWVLTLPYPLRYRCAYDSRLTSAVLRAFFRALFAELRRCARHRWRIPRGRCGSVTFIQRFGSALNANLHFHTLVLDGVYARTELGPTRFLPLPPPSRHEVAQVLAGTARRITRLLESRAEGDDDALARDEPLLATLASASLRTRIASGPHAGERWRRLGDRVEPEDPDADPEASRRVPEQGGMSLHADVAVPARDRRRLERLCHYVARPALASDRPDLRSWESGQDHVALYLYNGNEYLEGMLGAFKARCAPFNVNYRYVEEELLYLFDNADARCIVYHASFAPLLERLRPHLAQVALWLQVADESGNALLPGALDYEAALAQAIPRAPEGLSDDDLYVLYTGGTTGMPKGVLWRQADIFKAALAGGGVPASLEELAERVRSRPPIRVLPAPPFMHGAAHWARYAVPGDRARVESDGSVTLLGRDSVAGLAGHGHRAAAAGWEAARGAHRGGAQGDGGAAHRRLQAPQGLRVRRRDRARPERKSGLSLGPARIAGEALAPTSDGA